LRVARRIGDPGLGKALLAKLARVAPPTRAAIRPGVVAAVRHRVVDAELRAELDDLRLRQLDQRRVDLEPTAARGDLGERLERTDELGATIGITAGVEHVDADEQIARA